MSVLYQRHCNVWIDEGSRRVRRIATSSPPPPPPPPSSPDSVVKIFEETFDNPSLVALTNQSPEVGPQWGDGVRHLPYREGNEEPFYEYETRFTDGGPWWCYNGSLSAYSSDNGYFPLLNLPTMLPRRHTTEVRFTVYDASNPGEWSIDVEWELHRFNGAGKPVESFIFDVWTNFSYAAPYGQEGVRFGYQGATPSGMVGGGEGSIQYLDDIVPVTGHEYLLKWKWDSGLVWTIKDLTANGPEVVLLDETALEWGYASDWPQCLISTTYFGTTFWSNSVGEIETYQDMFVRLTNILCHTPTQTDANTVAVPNAVPVNYDEYEIPLMLAGQGHYGRSAYTRRQSSSGNFVPRDVGVVETWPFAGTYDYAYVYSNRSDRLELFGYNPETHTFDLRRDITWVSDGVTEHEIVEIRGRGSWDSSASFIAVVVSTNYGDKGILIVAETPEGLQTFLRILPSGNSTAWRAAVTPTSRVVLSGGEGMIGTGSSISYSDNGETWIPAECPNPEYGMWVISNYVNGTMVAVCYGEMGLAPIYSEDHGETWQESEILGGTWMSFYDVCWLDAQSTFYAVGYNYDEDEKFMVKSTDGGHSWTLVTVPHLGNMSGDLSLTAQRAFMAVSSEYEPYPDEISTLLYDANEDTWSAVALPDGPTLRCNGLIGVYDPGIPA